MRGGDVSLSRPYDQVAVHEIVQVACERAVRLAGVELRELWTEMPQLLAWNRTVLGKSDAVGKNDAGAREILYEAQPSSLWFAVDLAEGLVDELLPPIGVLHAPNAIDLGMQLVDEALDGIVQEAARISGSARDVELAV